MIELRDYQQKLYGDLIGKKFPNSRLTVLAIDTESESKNTKLICKCDCGAVRSILAYNLKSGHTQSCGCQSLENRVKARITHHCTGTRLYGIWSKMKDRCINPSNARFAYYGGINRTLCEEWHKFEPFRDWALANGYADNLTIDRIDNNKGYCPENCRWTTPREQANNTRKNRIIEYHGECHTLAEWSRIVNIKPITIAYRLNSGWSVKDALFLPVKRSKK